MQSFLRILVLDHRHRIEVTTADDSIAQFFTGIVHVYHPVDIHNIGLRLSDILQQVA